MKSVKNQKAFEQAVAKWKVAAAKKEYVDPTAFRSGYFEGMMESMFGKLSRSEQQYYIEMLNESSVHQQ